MLSKLRDALAGKLVRSSATSSTLRAMKVAATRDIQMELQKSALHSTVSYIEQRMLQVETVTSVTALLDVALAQVSRPGLYMEFGVAEGYTLNHIASKMSPHLVHGFDSFEGLPEFWVELVDTSYGKGAFDRKGATPSVRPNVQLHVGWFDQSLPEFLTTTAEEVAFIHVDCDLYSSTKIIFDQLGDRIKPGTVIAFNEYFNYPGWQHHEYKAFQELVEAYNLRYEYLTYNRMGLEVAVKIVE
jgi:hypothetical protein